VIKKQQKEVFDFVKEFSHSRGYSPSLEDIQKKLGFKSVSTAHYHVKKLQDMGFLKKEANRSRSIGVYADRDIVSPVLEKKGLDSVAVPILGAASAGPAFMTAEENIEGYLKVSRNVLSRKDGMFALRVEGDSMNKAKIGGKSFEEGDFVLIDSEYKSPRDGDYVLSIIDGHANLKRFRRNKRTHQITLESESTNSKYKPIFVSSDDHFIINGKIISVIKK